MLRMYIYIFVTLPLHRLIVASKLDEIYAQVSLSLFAKERQGKNVSSTLWLRLGDDNCQDSVHMVGIDATVDPNNKSQPQYQGTLAICTSSTPKAPLTCSASVAL